MRAMAAHRQHIPVLIWALIGISVGVEVAFWGSDLGLWGPPRLRLTAYEYGGFWPGLLWGWPSNFPGQSWVMFITYAFLHGGPGHLVMNMITLWSLGGAVTDRVGASGFAEIYLGSALGGAVAYGFLATSPQPMVGASGALFGLAGALLVWMYRDYRATGRGGGGVVRLGLLLVAINVVMYWALDGHLAWQTHLGGALAGGALVAVRQEDR